MTQQHDGDVLVVAADPEFRALAKHLLSRLGCAIREAGTGEEALTLAEERRPDWVALDVLLPDVTGYAVCQELRELFGEDVWIVFVSGDRTEPADRVAGLLLGADDYVVKPFDSDEFLARARRGLARARRSQQVNTAAPLVGLGDLTAREREVLRLLAEGQDQGAIADELFISPTTVSTHIQRILSKLGVHSRAQAVAVAHLEKLVELPTPSLEVGSLGAPDMGRPDRPEPLAPTQYALDGKSDHSPRVGVVHETVRSSDQAVQRIVGAPAEAPGSSSPGIVPSLMVFGHDTTAAARSSRDKHHEQRPAPAKLDSTPWWLDPSTARVCVSAVTGDLTDVSNEWAGLMRWQPEQLIGRHFMDFVLPEARADASSFFDVVRQVGEIRSRAHVRRGDGSTIAIEFRAVANGESIEVAYRPLSRVEPLTDQANRTSEALVSADTRRSTIRKSIVAQVPSG